MNRITLVVSAIILATSNPLWSKQEAPASEPLNDKGAQLEAAYTAEMEKLKGEIQAAAAVIDEGKKKTYQQALEAESAARSKFNSAQAATGGVQKAEGLVNHAKGKWIGGAKHGIKQAEKKLAAAKNEGQRNAAQKELEKWQKNLADGEKALQERMEALEMAKRAETEGPKMIKEAQEELARVKEKTRKVFQQIGMGKLIDDGAIDDKLVKYVVLMEGTPRGLAEFASQSPENEALITQLLSDTDLMRQMLVADGAQRTKMGRNQGPAQYGPAMKIYTDIQKKSAKAKGDDVHQKLALAIALEHSVPIQQRSAKADTSAPATVDPVNRYLHYEKAYADGELDPAFKDLSTWDLRMVVDGSEPDHILTWGRDMLRNYQPGHARIDYGWRYVRLVASDVRYGSGDVQYDRDELQFFQNILMNGGICGRRAFFGRFILRAFGIPTTARPSRGHAALAHWTPKGWVVNLGGGWGAGWTKGVYNKDRNFLASTQGRANPEAYLGVKRAMWIGDAMGEKRVYGTEGQGEPEFWGALSLQLQRSIIEDSAAEELAALGAEIGESNRDPEGTTPFQNATVDPEDIKISTDDNGIIWIPAAAYDKSASNAREARIDKSWDQGAQVFMPRFFAEGVTLLRTNSSAARMKSAGYGRYDNWGFRVAMDAPAGNPPAELKVDLGNGVSMDFVYIKPGKFTMGGDNAKEGRFDAPDMPKHEVTLTKGYYLGKYEVTQAQYEEVTGTNPSRTTKGPDYPANNISEGDALKFCEMASEKTGKAIRLPYEAEWEYAARAGTDTKYFFGDSDAQLGDYAWIKGNSETKTHPVGQKKPNPWGLYDIYGNAAERVADRYDKNYYAKGPKVDPTGPELKQKSLVTYKIDARKAGKYQLTAKVVTNNYGQYLIPTVNGEQQAAKSLPFTEGMWKDSKPVIVELKQGENTLQFHRLQPPQRGIAVKSFTLSPAGTSVAAVSQ
jgi:formylglycine-generating enzyme required for sulfatase activity